MNGSKTHPHINGNCLPRTQKDYIYPCYQIEDKLADYKIPAETKEMKCPSKGEG